MPRFGNEFEKFIETHIMGKHRELMKQEEQNFRRISKELERLEDQEKMIPNVDDFDLPDPFD
ncbi:hypothetical protein ACFOU2_13385 [Bacillus songklensis]|uniref:Uncharacterized protein n=1 Tax=Bacillus songklensis TaxID=1069116 RepID=A0ABV8B2D1_9BACI